MYKQTQKDTRFGALCVSLKLVPESLIDLALEEQQGWNEKMGEDKFIGDFLVEAGMITEKQRSLVLQKQRRDQAVLARRQGTKPDAAKAKELSESDDKRADATEGKNSEPTPDVPMNEIREDGLVLKVQHDVLKAYLIKTVEFDGRTNVDDIIQFTRDHNLIFGVVDESLIKGFLNSDFPLDKYFTVAKGRAPVESSDAQISYRFDSDYLQAGLVNEDGTIDFRKRGYIPEVKAGDVLAVKIPLAGGENGTNIYGDAILPSLAMDVEFKCGNGVEISGDGFSIRAAMDGYPKLDMDGTVSVVREYTIQGDVDYSTGHVNFDGNVNITGTIKNGFRVECHDVVVDSIEGGIVNCQGDVVVTRGVTKASIVTRGNLSAKYIHHSDVSCLGSLHVDKEVLESNAAINGACISEEGRILSSKIHAKLGVQVQNVGTEISKPSIITAGVSLYTEKELSRINAMIEREQNEIDKKTAAKDKLEADRNEIRIKIKEIEKAEKKSGSIVEQLNSKNLDKLTEQAVDVLNTLRTNYANIQKGLAVHYNQLDMLNNEFESHKKAVESGTKIVQKLVKEMLILRQMDNETQPNPTIEVQGHIMPGNRICGRYSQAIINEKMSRIRIREIALSQPGDNENPTYELSIMQLD